MNHHHHEWERESEKWERVCDVQTFKALLYCIYTVGYSRLQYVEEAIIPVAKVARPTV